MAKQAFGSFEDLIELASKFVEQQDGKWDHLAWLDFLSNIQKKGFYLSNDMQSFLGSMLESMKSLYSSVSNTSEMQNIMLGISENTITFIKKTQGSWDHAGWESFIKDLQKRGLSLTGETTNYLGGVLEAARELYTFPITGHSDRGK
ncbi:MAG: hypothetical protein L7F77_00615 [Candidatus Magnetominusculus sp. LBB02]|nr:hypothetical protein [Candidatus Magnetominusculus sp. LBB02]